MQNPRYISILSTLHYYPFGMLQPGRTYTTNSIAGYRFGFNGQLKDNDISGEGNIMTAEYWEYDSRLARRWNVEPLIHNFPWLSSYAVMDNNPILKNDPTGENPNDPIKIQTIKDNFANDKKPATNYQFTLYVNQPVRGSNAENSGINVGHTFIKLTKVNSDGTKTEAIFGFYPDHHNAKGDHNPFPNGSPFHSKTKSTFNNDKDHPWDVKIVVDINKNEFDKVLSTAEDFEKANYCLAGSNCSDFGIAAAAVIGVKVPTTTVDITLTGEGVTPGQLGQDLRDDADKIKEGKPTKTVSKKQFTIIRAQGKGEIKATGQNMPK